MQDIPRHEYEIIVVNDGSPDNSRGVVLNLRNEFSNILLIEQENKGVSQARNAGIRAAKGSFLLFIDPDDYVVPNALKQVLELAESRKAQVAILGYRFLDADGKIFADLLYEEHAGRTWTGIETYRRSRGDGKIDPDRSVGILYERSFVEKNDIMYVADVPYLEDGELVARVMCLADRCIFSGTRFYVRTTRAGSATNSRLFNDLKSINGFILAAERLRKQQSGSINEDQKIFLNQPILKFSLLAIQASIHGSVVPSLVRIRRAHKMLSGVNLDKLDLRGCIPFYKAYGRLYNISAYLFGLAWMINMFREKMTEVRAQ